MKHLNGWFIDENNNRWSDSIFTEDKAQESSKTLVDCSHCNNCNNCNHCYNCNHCNHCNHCNDCNNCNHCNDCEYCNHCYNCEYCNSCNHCNRCHNCYDCEYCHNCNDWKTNPQRIVSAKIGSRKSETTVYFDGTRTEVSCGCFGNKTLEEFELRVENVHGENEYGKQYKKFIAKVRKYIEE